MITILCPSSIKKDKSIQDLMNEYTKRIQDKVDIVDLNVKIKSNDTPDQIKEKQADAILSQIDKISNNTAIIALDERGKNFDSRELATQIANFQNTGLSDLCFIIGGAYGLSPRLLDRSNLKLSLGKMVWPHRLVSVMLLEQIYRAQQINSGHPYHKD